MQKTKEVARAGKRMGKKVMATDTAQDVVEVLVDGLEEVVVDKADDAGDALKVRAARAGGRAPKPTTAKKSTAKRSTAKKSTAKKPTAKKSTAKRSTAKKSTAKKSTAKKSTAKKSTAKKSTARKSTAGTSKAQRR
jgi:hypothetical protein